ncbi:hypothetical protein FPV67DRAFT_1484556 [Lyophyllum atratum]|nr:hypothetical protein FPV67DRAFT_1484556 [Lyophyllum atratum]
MMMGGSLWCFIRVLCVLTISCGSIAYIADSIDFHRWYSRQNANSSIRGRALGYILGCWAGASGFNLTYRGLGNICDLRVFSVISRQHNERTDEIGHN